MSRICAVYVKNLCGKCCAIKWEDINCAERSIRSCRNAVKTAAGSCRASFPMNTVIVKDALKLPRKQIQTKRKQK